jgi:NAD(P)-dependent dehydrogenase (short-subunit alcohol dehydrogenase family)
MNAPQPRTIVITGGTGGIGFQSALGIARTGARVVITGRNAERGEAARERLVQASGNDDIHLVLGDVSSVAGIDALAKALLDTAPRVDVLVNNAGYLGSEYRQSTDGLELHFAVNVLAPWRLTRALLPALQASRGARVLNVTGGDKPAAVDSDNLQAEKGFKGLRTYAHSKSAMESMSMVLARELEPEGVTVNVVYPGVASTAMTQAVSTKTLPGPMKLLYPLFAWMFRDDGGKSAAKAAQSTIWGATTDALDGVTGRYFDTHTKEQKLHPSGYDPAVQARIMGVIGSVDTRASA